MLIFLDSNILCSNYYMRGLSFEVLQKIGTIVLGQIIVDEVCNKYREVLEDKLLKLRKSVDDVNRIITEPLVQIETLDVESECRKYRDFLEFFIIESGMTIAEEYPNVKHEDVVKRALARKKPFKADGSTGYRDYLVWETCLNLARFYSCEEIHFISSNIRDFADATKKNVLHSDLRLDLSERGISERRFHYWSSIKNFIDEYASTKISEIEKQESTIKEIEENETGYRIPLQQFLKSSVVGIDLSGYDVLVPGDSAVIKNIELSSDFNIDEIAELEDGQYLLEISIDCLSEVVSDIDAKDIKELDEYSVDVEVICPHQGNRCTLEMILGTQVHLKAIFDRQTKTISSIELDDINDYNCPYCPYE